MTSSHKKSKNEVLSKSINDHVNEVEKDAYRRGMWWGAALMLLAIEFILLVKHLVTQ